MKTPQRNDVAIHRVDERRYAVTVDGVVRYVGTLEECERRAIILDLRIMTRQLERSLDT